MFILQSVDADPPRDDENANERIASLNKRVEELNLYIQKLIEERNTSNKIIAHQLHIYEDAKNVLSEIQKIKLIKDSQSIEDNNIKSEYEAIKTSSLNEMKLIQDQIRKSNDINGLNLDLEIAYARDMQRMLDLELKVKYLSNQLKISQNALLLEENINQQLSESANKIKEYINQITNIINSSQVIEDSKKEEIAYYVETIESLSGDLSTLRDKLDLSISKNNEQESQIYLLNEAVKYYESLNGINSVDSIIEYICNVYNTIYQSDESIIDYINRSELSSKSKSNILELIKKIMDDQYMRHVNFKIISYIMKTQELKQYLSSFKSVDYNVAAEALKTYMDYVDSLKLDGGSIDKNNQFINQYLGRVLSDKYDKRNLIKDTIVLASSINTVYLDGLKLDTKKISVNKSKDKSDLLLQKQMNLLLNLIILFNMFEITKDRQAFEERLENYNNYVNLLSRISENKYETYSDVPNNKILENLKTKLNINIREYINAIGRNASEHRSISKLGVRFNSICGDSPSVNVKNSHKAVVNIEKIIKKEMDQLTPDITDILKHIESNEIYVILELFANKV